MVQQKKILFVVSSHSALGSSDKKTGFDLEEFAIPYMYLKNQGYLLLVASPKGGEAPVDPNSIKRCKENETVHDFLKDEENKKGFQESIKLENVDPMGIAAVYIVGGHGPLFDLPKNQRLQHIIRTVYEKGDLISAIGHGPAGLLNVKLTTGENLVQGKRVTCFSNKEEESMGSMERCPFALEDELKQVGAEVIVDPKGTGHVINEHRLLTGQNPNSSLPLAKLVDAYLKEKRA